MAMYGTFGGPANMFGGSLYNPVTGAESRDYVPLSPNDPRVTMGRPGGNMNPVRPTDNINYLGGSASFNERNPVIVQTDQSQQGPSQGMTGQGPFRNPYRQQNPFMQQPPMQTGQYQGGFGQAQYNPFSAGIGSLFGGMGGYGMGYNPMQSMYGGYGNPYISSYGMGFNPMMGMYGMGNYNPYATMMSMGGFNPFAGQQNVFSQGSMGVPYGTGTLPTSRPVEQTMTNVPSQPVSTPTASPAPAPAMPAAQQMAAAPAPSPASAPKPVFGGGEAPSPEVYAQQVAAETAKKKQQLADLDAYQVPTSSRWYQYLQNPASIGRMAGETDQDLIRRIKGNAREEEQRAAYLSSLRRASGGLTSLLSKFRK